MLCCSLLRQRGCSCEGRDTHNCKITTEQHRRFIAAVDVHNQKHRQPQPQPQHHLSQLHQLQPRQPPPQHQLQLPQPHTLRCGRGCAADGWRSPSITGAAVAAGLAAVPELCGVVAYEPAIPHGGVWPHRADSAIFAEGGEAAAAPAQEEAAAQEHEQGAPPARPPFWRAWTSVLTVGPTLLWGPKVGLGRLARPQFMGGDPITQHLVANFVGGRSACTAAVRRRAMRAVDRFDVVLSVKGAQFGNSSALALRHLNLTLPVRTAGGGCRPDLKMGCSRPISYVVNHSCDDAVLAYAAHRIAHLAGAR